VQVEAFAIRLRQRSPMEAADLGVRLCQSAAGSVWRCYLLLALPVTVFALASFEIASWLPMLALWWFKPWLDRGILFALSRAAFGMNTALSDLWQARRQVWWSQWWRSVTTRRLSPWRSFTQPIYQLEGLRGRELRQRIKQLRAGRTGSPVLVGSAFSLAEYVIVMVLLLLAYAFTPRNFDPQLGDLFSEEGLDAVRFSISAAYAGAVLLLEPFYVAAGFALYLNRRVELEAWDLEQEFRRADFAHAVR
jgi:hypothetical protein